MASNRRELLSKAKCGLCRVHQLFGAKLPQVIETLNRELAA